jgi:hypothetical protein
VWQTTEKETHQKMDDLTATARDLIKEHPGIKATVREIKPGDVLYHMKDGTFTMKLNRRIADRGYTDLAVQLSAENSDAGTVMSLMTPGDLLCLLKDGTVGLILGGMMDCPNTEAKIYRYHDIVAPSSNAFWPIVQGNFPGLTMEEALYVLTDRARVRVLMKIREGRKIVYLGCADRADAENASKGRLYGVVDAEALMS